MVLELDIGVDGVDHGRVSRREDVPPLLVKQAGGLAGAQVGLQEGDIADQSQVHETARTENTGFGINYLLDLL